ncbi:hypothetical protein ACSW9O_00365 [Clostridium perfringens]|uniref:hypothetical protein n=1 Tax=Clostridium perfringens TaxID=1502 RepID=UPI0013E3C305|nr:hypothetical protein [Clostridium perfringens]MDU5248840.1 hypothetical protein [Clostridium perfringens]NGT84958.1 hypothetical protein [Clostridium perfringens]BDA35682.1 hypothetical protein CPBEC5_26900 [Clostridium perfringens]HAT4349056.1 hypothetical protein [Clostridium perfringens]HCG3019276.1 hypothetical protein [Clostridium perfringens]
MKIDFPKNLIISKAGVEFLCLVWRITKKHRNQTIIWNFKYTKKLETNLLSFLGLILNRSYKHNNNIILIMRDNCGNVCKYNSSILEILFDKYSELKNDAINYRYLNLKSIDIDYKKDTLYKDILELNLKYYKEVKILISEFIANINMHTELKECAISGYLDINNEHLIFSICNMGKTIRQNIKESGSLEFESDTESIIWALKKTNTTRNYDESGGLGLYLLRKYLHEIDGIGHIVSGKSIIELESGFYNNNDINNIILESENKIEMDKCFFPGTLITIKVPYIFNTKIDKNEVGKLKDFSLI